MLNFCQEFSGLLTLDPGQKISGCLKHYRIEKPKGGPVNEELGGWRVAEGGTGSSRGSADDYLGHGESVTRLGMGFDRKEPDG